MPKHSRPRKGSLQIWPRKRASKLIPSVNWDAVPKTKNGFLGFICYKVGMKSLLVKDNTENSMTKGQRIIIPATVLEAPPLKILSVRFYKGNKIAKEIFLGGEKELKHKLKLGKVEEKPNFDVTVDYDSIRVIAYSLVNRSAIKKTPDIIELGIGGTKEEQLETVKNFANKEIMLKDVFTTEDKLVDLRGLTKGKGMSGPSKRFGITRRQHKSEKGVKKVGSIGPWHPARVMFSVPMAGQLGFFSRLAYNNKIVAIGKTSEKNINPGEGFKHFGKIKGDYIMLRGSVMGPEKRQILLTQPIRPVKGQLKLNYEFVKIAN
jgi:large subunit ribosomal protein L3